MANATSARRLSGMNSGERNEHTGGLKTGIAVQNIKILVFKIVKAGYKGTISVLLCLEED